jgi:TPR repeat protein
LVEVARPTETAGWVRDAAEHGFAQAQMLLGSLYAHGLGVAADAESAAVWMRRAEEQGYPHAACELGRLHATTGNRSEAIRCFRRGAAGDCSAAEIGLARLLLDGPAALAEPPEEAMVALRKASERGAAEAHLILATLHERRGQMEAALEACRAAAMRRYLPAQVRLGSLLSDGVSTRPDYVEAWLWFSLAAGQGDRMAAVQARSVERKLTPEQRADARIRLRQTEELLIGGE